MKNTICDNPEDIQKLLEQIKYYREALRKIAMHSDSKGRYLANRALGRYKEREENKKVN